MLVLGLVLVLGSGFGFWFILRSVDDRSEYLVAARTFERWDVARGSDFTVVEANVGTGTALAAHQSGSVVGKWATGRIPAGTFITAGLFEAPPLSSESEADRVLIEVQLAAADAPFGTLEAGDTVALLGRETGEDGSGDLGLIGVLQLDFVEGNSLFYVVTPDEALAIKNTVDRFAGAADRTMLKLGFGLTTEDLVAALDARAAGSDSVAPGVLPVPGSEFEPAGAQS